MAKRPAKSKVVRISHFTKKNGDVYEKRLVREPDGKSRIMSKRIACGIPNVPELPSVRVEIVATNRGRPVPGYLVSGSAKAKKASSPKKPSARPKTYKRNINQFARHYQTDRFVTDIKNTIVETTSRTHEILKRAKARDGNHILLFEQDFALLSQGLRSINWESVGGGSSGSVSLPIKRIQAQDRLVAFEREFPKAYKICKRIFVDGVDPSDLPVTLTQKKKGGVNRLIQQSVDDLAEFYNAPANMKKDRALISSARSLESYFR